MTSTTDAKNNIQCTFCKEYIPPNKSLKHRQLHIKDINTPASVLKDGKYYMQYIDDYSNYTIYGMFAMLKKFIDIELPTQQMFNETSSSRALDFRPFYSNIKDLKNVYFATLYSENDKQFLSNAQYVINGDLFKSCMKILDHFNNQGFKILRDRIVLDVALNIKISLEVLEDMNKEKEKSQKIEQDIISAEIAAELQMELA